MGISEAWDSVLRMFSLNTYTGEINVFNNFSKLLSDLRGTVMSISIEVAKQVFEGGSEIFKGVRDEFVRAFGGNPSSGDAGKSIKSMSDQTGVAKSAISGMPSMNNLLGGPSSSLTGGGSATQPPNQDLSKKLANQRMMRDYYAQG